MKTVEQTEQEIISDFSLFDTWEEKYQYIIELGQQLPPLDDRYKDEAHKVKGCQSSVWLHCYRENGRLYFQADSDSLFVKGEIALLIRVLNGRTPEEILHAPLTFIDAIGLRQHLSMTRAHGLASMIRHMKEYAHSLQQQ
jgi:cysteine desulfuration protein SufE